MLRLYNKLKNNFKFIDTSLLKGIYINNFEINLFINSNALYFILKILKKKTQFQLSSLIDIFVYDNPGILNRFFLSYNFLSIKYNTRVNICLSTSELKPIISIISLFSSACWLEREAWDMFGIFFLFNPNLSRILTDYGFKGYPLRKDFPLTGYFEVFYNDLMKSIVFSKISLAQDYRNFSFHFLQTSI